MARSWGQLTVAGLLLASLAYAVACDDPPAARDAASDVRDDVRDPDGPALEVGTGGTAYEAIDDGGPIELVHGPQGGYHLLLAARFRGLDPDGLSLGYQVFRADGTPLNERFTVRLRASTVTPSGRWFHRTGDLGILSIDGPEDVIGAMAEIRAEATASDGSAAAHVLRVLIVDDE